MALVEAGHSTFLLTLGIKSHSEINEATGLTTPIPPCNLTLEQNLALLCAGAVSEWMLDPCNDSLHAGLGGDATIIARLLGVPEAQSMAYATATALLTLGSKARLIPPPEHIELLRTAIAEAKQTLACHQRVLKHIATTLTEHGSC